MNTVAELTLSALQDFGTPVLPRYARILAESCAAHEPPFGMAWYGERYRSYAADPHWLATSLVANAEVEGDGATKLWNIAGRSDQQEMARLIQQHAVDEAGHARLYLSMLKLVFPDALSPDLSGALQSLPPSLSMYGELPNGQAAPTMRMLDDLVQMNIGEIRTRIHQQLLRPVILAHCPVPQRARIERALDGLLEDETRHIAYTAQLIEQHCTLGHEEFVRMTTAKRLAQFNEITLNEVGALIFDGE